MNVIGSRPDKWWNDPDRAMRDLAALLDRFVAATGDEVTLVFDREPEGLEPPARVRVVVARRRGRNAADYEIEQIVAADSDPSTLAVVTSDKRLVETVRGAGARVVGSGRFRKRLDAHAAEEPT